MPNATLNTSPAHVRSSFFLRKKLYPGAELKNVSLIKRTIIGNFFVPRTEADAISWTSENLPKILERFSMASGSKDAELMEKAIINCEGPPMKGEKIFALHLSNRWLAMSSLYLKLLMYK
jgi:BURP domain